jgi:hypothetical protein
MGSNPALAVRLYTWFAVSAGGFAAIETFGRIESAQLAALLWGGFLLTLGAGHTLVLLIAKRPRGWWSWWLGHSLTAIIAGAVSISFAQWDQAGLVVWSMGTWAVAAGATTLVQARRLEKSTERSDWFVVGSATLLLGLVTLAVPADVVWMMGMAGVWASILTVFLGIGAVNLSMANRRQRSE